jgi:cephalosporin hydroxylase
MQNTWLGFPIQQCPFDMQVYQELLFKIRPRRIVQTGVCYGGSLQYFAGLLDLMGADPSVHVIGIDITLTESAKSLTHPRIKLIEGSSTSPEVVAQVRRLVGDESPVLVSLDSDHTRDHVRSEMDLYGPLVTRGSYMVVEDTNVNGHPVLPGFGPGPHEAVEDYLRTRQDFVRDESIWRRNFMSFHQGGWLRKL